MDASSLPSSEPDQFFDAVETQSNPASSMFNTPTAMRTRPIVFSSPSLSQDEDKYRSFHEPILSQSRSRSLIPSAPPPSTC